MATVDIDESLFCDEAAEHLLAASLLSTTTRHELPALFEQVAPDDFYNGTYGALWRAAGNLHTEGKRISRRTLIAACDGEIPRVAEVVERLAGEYVPEHELAPAAQSLPEKAKWRELVRNLSGSLHAATLAEDYDEALERAQNRLARLTEGQSIPRGVRRLSDAVSDWWDYILAEDEAGDILPLPWEHLNDALAGGLHTKRTYIVGARPGGGKTLMLLNAAAGIAEAGHPSLFVSLEMPEREAVSRIMAAGAEAEYGQITRRQIDDHNMRRLALYSDHRVADTALYIIDESSMTVEKIAAHARRMKEEVGLKFLAVDYAGIVRPTDRSEARHAQLHHISWMLSILAKELDIAIMFAAQLNRGPETENTKPKKSDLRESGSLEQNADVILLLHHELIEGIKTGDVTVVLAKNRTGPEMEIMLPFRPHLARIG